MGQSEEELRTVGAALDEIGFGRAQLLLVAYTGLAWLADACETMLLSFLGPAARCYFVLSPTGESLLTSVIFAAMLAGVTSLGVVADQCGRRRGFLASALLMGAAGLASAVAPTYAWLLAARGVVGFALGGTPIALTLYAEFCTSAARGRWLLLLQGFWSLGSLFEAALAWAVLPTLGWRWLLALSAAPLLLLLALYPWLPESPYWLVAQRRYAEAEAVLQRVAATNGYPPGQLRLRLAPGGGSASRSGVAAPAAGAPAAEQLLQPGGSGLPAVLASSGSMRARSPAPTKLHADGTTSPGPQAPLLSAAAARQPAADPQQEQHDADSTPLLHRQASSRRGFRAATRGVQHALAVLFGRQLRRSTLLLLFIWVVNALLYYGLVLLTTALQAAAHKEACVGRSPNLDSGDYLAILVTTLAEAPGLLLAAALIDTRGRLWALRACLLPCAAALGALLLGGPRGAQLGALFVARGCIEGSYSVLYVLSGELYPTKVRSTAMAAFSGCSRVGGFLAPFATVALVASGHTRAAAALLAGLCGGAALCAFLLPHETRGRDLQAGELQPDGSRDLLGGARRQPGSPVGGGGTRSDSLRHVHVHQERRPRWRAGEELELEPPHPPEGPLLPLPSGPEH